MRNLMSASVCSIVLLLSLVEVRGHGYLLVPPGRSSMWRAGFSVPVNFNDNQLYCGGFHNQWNVNGGKCGTCGDPYQLEGPSPNDGGKYDTGTIAAQYSEGQHIDITVIVTAHHKGYFMMKFCPNGNLTKGALQNCLNKTVLKLTTPSGVADKYYPSSKLTQQNFIAKLPAGVSCSHCVLQWVYRTGNSWGTDEDGTGLGHGPQEHFINCADIRIVGPGRTPAPTPAPAPVPAVASAVGILVCRAAEAWSGQANMDRWCVTNCAAGNCPPSHCVCSSPTPASTPANAPALGTVCRATGAWSGQASMDQWCFTSCAFGNCPPSHCVCSSLTPLRIPASSPAPIPASFPTPAPGSVCKATGAWSGQAGMDLWCNITCATGYCPRPHCVCISN